MHRIVPFALLALVAGAFVAGGSLREQSGIELSAESIQGFVRGLGPSGPLVFLGLVVFRNALVLPSFLVLVTGGLLFGIGMGTLLGGLGVALSGLFKCGVARGVGREWVRPRLEQSLGDRLGRIEGRLRTAGPVFVGLNAAHPIGLLSPLHWGYGLTSLPWQPFAVALALGAPLRAFFCSYFGSTLVEPGSRAFFLASAALLACALVPLAVPALRRRLLIRP
jgi:uncharacterized membrane protein YdjX (TVP38/TMEM64 family)